jgi:hypothetical protein
VQAAGGTGTETRRTAPAQACTVIVRMLYRPCARPVRAGFATMSLLYIIFCVKRITIFRVKQIIDVHERS